MGELINQIPTPPGGDAWLQYGALALVAMVIIYITGKLVSWLTSTLDDKLDALTVAIEKQTEAIDNLTEEIGKIRRDLEYEQRQRRGL